MILCLLDSESDIVEKVLVIVGPTAVGKTKLSVELAKIYNGEIINADSTQVYKGMDIATAKVTDEKKENIPHHLFDIKNIDENYTVFDFQRDCRNKIKEICAKGKLPILVGGTGLYIKAALYDYNFEAERKTSISYSEYSNVQLYEKLKLVDPCTTIHPNNRKRVERALMYFEMNQKPFSEKEKTSKLLYNALFIGLTTDRSNLYERINYRVDVMMKNGLLEEAYKIYKSGIRTKAVLTPIGYKELFSFFEKEKSLEECIDILKQSSRRYAKRQYTWFYNQMNVKWFDTDYGCFYNTVNEVAHYIDKM